MKNILDTKYEQSPNNKEYLKSETIIVANQYGLNNKLLF